jgi:hypothetical protein
MNALRCLIINFSLMKIFMRNMKFILSIMKNDNEYNGYSVLNKYLIINLTYFLFLCFGIFFV